jgi:hypothetical protein
LSITAPSNTPNQNNHTSSLQKDFLGTQFHTLWEVTRTEQEKKFWLTCNFLEEQKEPLDLISISTGVA